MVNPLVKVFLNARNIKTLINLGYSIPRTSKLKNIKTGYSKGDFVLVALEHLTPGSKSLVERVCDSCGREDKVPFRDLGSRELCKSCSKKSMVGKRNGFHSKKHSTKTREKLSKAHKKMDDSLAVAYLDRTKAAPTSTLAARELNFNRQTILNAVNRCGRRDLLFKNPCRSTWERNLAALIRTAYKGPIIENDRKVLDGKELDLYLPELGIAFEFNGLYWHCDKHVSKGMHRKKYLTCKAQGISLYTFWEHQQGQALNQFVENLVSPKVKLMARKCKVVSDNRVLEFIEKWHLQGVAKSHTYLGLEYLGEVVMAVSVSGHHRLGRDTQVLNRVCFSKYHVVGGLAKLLKQCPRPLITWSDNCYSPNGGMYERAGFEKTTDLPMDYFYTAGDSTYFSKQSQAKKRTNCPEELTESEWARSRKLFRVWDCGKVKWTLR